MRYCLASVRSFLLFGATLQVVAIVGAQVKPSETEPGEPVSFEFDKRYHDIVGYPKTAWEPKSQTYHVDVRTKAMIFTIKSVVGDLEKRRILIAIRGMVEKPDAPLTLSDKDDKRSACTTEHTTRNCFASNARAK